jgi:hypothetical protein
MSIRSSIADTQHIFLLSFHGSNENNGVLDENTTLSKKVILSEKKKNSSV